jgi:hypothetical protein
MPYMPYLNEDLRVISSYKLGFRMYLFDAEDHLNMRDVFSDLEAPK